MAPLQTDEQDVLYLAQVAAGGPLGERAAESLFKRHFRWLLRDMEQSFRFAAGISEELVLEAFARAFKAAAKFRKQAKVSTWLYTIVFHLHADHKEKTDKVKMVNDPDWDEISALIAVAHEPDTSAEQEAFAQCVDEQFVSFAIEFPECGQAMRKFYYGQCSLRDVAKLFGTSEDTMRSRMYQCRKRFRKFASECLKFLGKKL